ncbi:hypothetical protein CAPTEDRAFT_166358 [Capitella teleta]|uniref:Lethal giant larvae homologue 2 domain-containing protein n=1 Tax=Capitella teleta TaxID=283909 RepID=R7TAS0_CAPTE|nr:hypothetical protein CAPTEDRAFT_166358 [Capitella teleta]|eukprot:ELT88587.1 hypothetical protein CAPTEDRAFT_166358 [Capitella teleta]
MDTVLKRFGLKKGVPRESEARLKLQKELFAFTKCGEHGFPNKPSALAYDPKLRLLAIGTKTGALRVYGAPGVEFSGQHDEDIAVTHLMFVSEQGRLITHCSDNSLHLWEINSEDETSALECVRSLDVDANKVKNISSVCLTTDGEQIFFGTEGGNIHIVDIKTFTLSENSIQLDTIMQNVPDDFKVSPGAVETIQQSPTDAQRFLIGYNRGLVVLWDNEAGAAKQIYNCSQVRSTHPRALISPRASYFAFTLEAGCKLCPFPCKAITNIRWKTAKPDAFVFFAGGMPRASYGDRHTVTAMQGSMHQVFDFTSRVVDFVPLNSADELESYDKIGAYYDDPHTLIVLAEEELVAIDLTSEGWQTYRPPYLSSLHSSAITCASHSSNVPEALWNKICAAGEPQFANCSVRDWPISGGKNFQQNLGTRDLLLTGHEDGSVRFWDASTTAVKLLYRLSTANIFGLDLGTHDQTVDEEEWPPFRKVGSFDPYSDDPRLGIQKVNLCPLSETLVIGGTAGQVIVSQLERDGRELEVKSQPLNLVSDREGFVWKGHDALPVSVGDVKFVAGFQPVCIMQLQPPAACTALAVNTEWQLVSAGTAHGFGVFDYAQKVCCTTKCTLNPADMTGSGESAMSRRKSFKKSLRESFRRLRKRRSERRMRGQRPARDEKVEEAKPAEGEAAAAPEAEGDAPAAPAAEGAAAAASAEASPKAAAPSPKHETAESPKSVERSVEFRSTDDAMASMVRTLHFADTFLLNAQHHSPTLWAGTNAGTVYIFQITLPASDKRDAEQVQCVLGKEIQLKHRAPVIFISVIDRNAQPLPAALEVQHERAKAPDMTGQHQVLICSEEQFKMFSLPSLKAHHKFKLTAQDGAKARRISFVNFRSKSDDRYVENDLVCLTNIGDVQVFSVPPLRRQLRAECIKKENVSGIISSVFTQSGEGFFLNSPSEFVRFSVSARMATKPSCAVIVKEGARLELAPLPEPEPEPEPATAEPEAAAAAATTEEQPATEEAAATEETPAAEPAAGESEAVEQRPDDSMVSAADTSVASGDITRDSVTVHLSESASEQRTVVSSSRTVVTKTLMSERHSEGGVITHQETRTVQSESRQEGDGPMVTQVATSTHVENSTDQAVTADDN